MNIEKVVAGEKGDLLNEFEVAAFADVDDALNHD
jgi:hypothetical protein